LLQSKTNDELHIRCFQNCTDIYELQIQSFKFHILKISWRYGTVLFSCQQLRQPNLFVLLQKKTLYKFDIYLKAAHVEIVKMLKLVEIAKLLLIVLVCKMATTTFSWKWLMLDRG
jgi:hypothetical protein